jgi:hypothetical protein
MPALDSCSNQQLSGGNLSSPISPPSPIAAERKGALLTAAASHRLDADRLARTGYPKQPVSPLAGGRGGWRPEGVYSAPHHPPDHPTPDASSPRARIPKSASESPHLSECMWCWIVFNLEFIIAAY